MKRLLQITNYYYPHIGGIEQVTREIVNAVRNDDTIEQKVLCFNETAKDGEFACKREETKTEEVDGVEIIRCGCITKKASQSISLTFGKQLKELLQSNQPDTVIFHYPNPFQASYLLKQLPKDTRLILYWHLDITKQKNLGKLFHHQTIRLLERANDVIATSPVYIDGSPYLSKYKAKCTVIPNCINEDRLTVTQSIQKRAEEIRAQYGEKILCFAVGRHIPYKGYDQLIEAAKLLDDRFRIVIGGEGPLTAALKTQAKGDARIRFVGRLSNEELIAYFLAMDIFCFPSVTKNEAFGIALAEAMYFGKPAATFTIPGSGVNYVSVNGLTGLEVENRNIQQYADALLTLGNDPEKRKDLGQAARKRVEELFLSTAFQRSILELLKRSSES